MSVRHISSGSAFEDQIGYSRAVVVDGWVLVSGTTGYDYQRMQLAEGIAAQCRQALDNVARALAEAGASLDDVVRVHYILADGAEFPDCWPMLREAFVRARPAATMIEARMMQPEMRFEIEVTARLPKSAD